MLCLPRQVLSCPLSQQTPATCSKLNLFIKYLVLVIHFVSAPEDGLSTYLHNKVNTNTNIYTCIYVYTACINKHIIYDFSHIRQSLFSFKTSALLMRDGYGKESDCWCLRRVYSMCADLSLHWISI